MILSVRSDLISKLGITKKNEECKVFLVYLYPRGGGMMIPEGGLETGYDHF
jgi:hypothetical protein